MSAETVSSSPADEKSGWLMRVLEVLDVMSGTPRLLGLIWKANPALCFVVLLLNLTLALIPLLEMELTKAILDAIARGAGAPLNGAWALTLMGLGAALTLTYFLIDPSMWVCQEKLADLLTRDINVMLLHKANSLVDIALFETPEFYDKLETAQRQASWRPINVLHEVCSLIRQITGTAAMLFCCY